MKRNARISLMLALLIILSSLAVVTPSSAAGSEKLCVVKKVCNGGGWHNSVHAVYGDIVKFKVTITYNGEHCAENIVATDTLPSGLEYVETLEPEDIYPIVNGNVIVWDLGETYLEPYCSTEIIFRAEVVGVGENVNEVNVTAIECCPDHEIYGVDTTTVFVDPSVDVQKNAWDPEEQKWVDELGWVIKGQNVRFQITSTYHGEIPMKCMLVKDCLPGCCFEYANNVLIKIAGATISKDDARYPEITINDYIWFDWKSANFYLEDGESVIIEFDAKVINYCEQTVTNWAWVFLWGCYTCDPDNYVFGWDSATVQCYPHDPIFEKTVWNGQAWAEKANVYVDDTIRYKIALTYYGNENLTNIKIADELPCVLKYADNEKVKIYHYTESAIENLDTTAAVSENKKVTWWNFTKELSDHDTLSIEFDAIVTGITGDCEDCGVNIASYTGYADDHEYSDSDTAKIYSTHRPPAPPAYLTISIKKFSIGRIKASIKNTGESSVSLVNWSISVTGGALKRIDAKANGKLVYLDTGESAPISTAKRSIKRGFGRISITVTAIVGEDTFELTAKGFVFGRIIITRTLYHTQ